MIRLTEAAPATSSWDDVLVLWQRWNPLLRAFLTVIVLIVIGQIVTKVMA